MEKDLVFEIHCRIEPTHEQEMPTDLEIFTFDDMPTIHAKLEERFSPHKITILQHRARLFIA